MADLEQFQTQQVEFDEDCNNCEDKTVNDVTPERLSRLAVESAFDVFNRRQNAKFSFEILKFIFKRKIVCSKANEHNRVFR